MNGKYIRQLALGKLQLNRYRARVRHPRRMRCGVGLQRSLAEELSGGTGMRKGEGRRQNYEGMRWPHHCAQGKSGAVRDSRGGTEGELAVACGGEAGGLGGRRKREEAGEAAEEAASPAKEDWAAADLAGALPGSPRRCARPQWQVPDRLLASGKCFSEIDSVAVVGGRGLGRWDV